MKRLIVLPIFIVVFILALPLSVKGLDETKPLYSFTNPLEVITYYNSEEAVVIPNQGKKYKHYFRAAYIFTDENEDFPLLSSNVTNRMEVIDEFANDYQNLLDVLAESHINVLIFQVRPLLDAFYPSEYNPWSQYLMGTEGEFIEGWDPLAFMIEEAHLRGIEFHAYLNAFKVSNLTTAEQTKQMILSTLSPNNFARKHPDYVLIGKDLKLYLNPAEEAVMDYFLDTVEELVRKYDVDAIHLDSEIYPSGGFVGDLDFVQPFKESRSEYQTPEAFRQAKLNTLLQKIDLTIDQLNFQLNRSVQFGVRYHSVDGLIDLERLFYHVDYVIPEVTERFEGNESGGYADLLREGVKIYENASYQQFTPPNLYIGINALFDSADYERELKSYLLYNQRYDSIQGVAFYHLPDLTEHKTQYETFKTITKDLYASIRFLPPALKTYNPDIEPPNFDLKRVGGTVKINWRRKDSAKYYVLYRVESKDTSILREELLQPENILQIFKNDPNKSVFTYTDTTTKDGKNYKYALTVIDRANRETTLPIILDFNPSIQTNQTPVIILFVVTSVIAFFAVVVSSYLVLRD